MLDEIMLWPAAQPLADPGPIQPGVPEAAFSEVSGYIRFIDTRGSSSWRNPAA